MSHNIKKVLWRITPLRQRLLSEPRTSDSAPKISLLAIFTTEYKAYNIKNGGI